MTVMAYSNGENMPSDTYMPHPHQSNLFCPDPELGLTPERSPLLASKKSVRFVSPAKSKAKLKMVLPGKENTRLADVDLPVEDRSQTKPSQSKPKRKHKQGKTRVKVVQESSACVNSTSEENHLDTAELHTTLHLGRDILKLQTMNIDVVEAVKHRLTISEQDRNNVKQKTYAKLNERPKSPSVFGEVLSLNVPTESVVGHTERQLSKAVRPLSHRQKPAMDKPALSKLFKPELTFHRCVSLDQHGYQPRALQINLPRVDQAAFEHHDRITLWEHK